MATPLSCMPPVVQNPVGHSLQQEAVGVSVVCPQHFLLNCDRTHRDIEGEVATDKYTEHTPELIVQGARRHSSTSAEIHTAAAFARSQR